MERKSNLQEMQKEGAIIQLTTVCIDKYGRWYDLAVEHPSWIEAKKNNEAINIVINAFTCTKEQAIKMTTKTKKKKK